MYTHMNAHLLCISVINNYFCCINYILIVANHLDAIKKVAPEQLLSREKFHVDAFRAYASGDLPAACEHWAKCTLEHPRGPVSCNTDTVSTC